MAFQSCPEIAQVILTAQSDGVEMANIFHYRHAGGYVLADLQTLAAEFQSIIVPLYLPIMHDASSIDDIVVRGLELENDISYEIALTGQDGTATGSPLPNNQSLVITHRSGFSGRSARGRTYLFPTASSFLSTPAVLTSGYSTVANDLGSALITVATTFGWSFVVLSRFSGKVKRPVGVGFNVATSGTRNLRIDSQRNRLIANH